MKCAVIEIVVELECVAVDVWIASALFFSLSNVSKFMIRGMCCSINTIV